MDQDFQRLAKEVGLTLGDSAGEEGFGMDQQPGQEVGFELAWVYWLVEYLGAQRLHSAQLLQDPTGSWGGDLQGVTCPGLRPALEGPRAPVKMAYLAS